MKKKSVEWPFKDLEVNAHVAEGRGRSVRAVGRGQVVAGGRLADSTREAGAGVRLAQDLTRRGSGIGKYTIVKTILLSRSEIKNWFIINSGEEIHFY